MNTYSKEFRDDCLARWVNALGKGDWDDGHKRREEWLRDYEKRHGKAESDRLRDLMDRVCP